MSHVKSRGKAYCNYCWTLVAMKNDVDELWQHKPQKYKSSRYDYCPGPSFGVGFTEKKPGDPRSSDFGKDLRAGIWKTIEGEGETLFYNGVKLGPVVHSGGTTRAAPMTRVGEEPAKSGWHHPDSEPEETTEPITLYPDVATYAHELREKAVALLPDAADKHVWDRDDVTELLQAFLTLEPEAADTAARAVGVPIPKRENGVSIAGWETPDGARLYTEQEYQNLHNQSLNLIDDFETKVKEEVDKQLAEMDDDVMATRITELESKLHAQEMVSEDLEAQLFTTRQRSGPQPVPVRGRQATVEASVRTVEGNEVVFSAQQIVALLAAERMQRLDSLGR